MKDVNLLFEAAYMTLTSGSVQGFAPDEIFTVIQFAPPLSPSDMVEGRYNISVRNRSAQVELRTITDPSDDPLRSMMGKQKVGPVLPDKSPLGFEAVSDHHGAVPFVLVTVTFFSMIANWQKPLSTDDHADVKITDQLPRDRDKIIALEALNGVLRDGAHQQG
jgi:hypothetical protein